MKRIHKLILVIFFIIYSLSLAGQTLTGRIEGTVTNPEGEPLAGIKISASSTSFMGNAETVTSTRGRFRLLALKPGNYTVTFRGEGFREVMVTDISLLLEHTATLNVRMHQQQSGSDTTGGILDLKSYSHQQVLTTPLLQTLPRGRDFTSLALLMPGVNVEPLLAGISFHGASGAENLYVIDGMDTTRLYGGTQGIQASYEFMDQVQVRSSGIEAEFDGATGGVINAITRSGSNEFHGSIFGYYSGAALMGKKRDYLCLNPADTTLPEYANPEDDYGRDPSNTIEPGFNISGFIFKDRIWFNAIFLPKFQNTRRVLSWLSERLYGDTSEINETWWNWQGKLSILIAKNLRVNLSAINNFYITRGILATRAAPGPRHPLSDYGFDFPAWTAAAAIDYTLGNNLHVSLRGGIFHRNQTNQQVTESEPRWYFFTVNPTEYRGIVGPGIFDDIPEEYIRPPYWSNYSYSEGFEIKNQIRNRQSFSLDLSYLLNAAGEHHIKTGLQWIRLEEDIDTTYTHPYIIFDWGGRKMWYGEEFRGRYGVYAVRGGGAGHPSGVYGTYANPHSIRLALYLQDSWTITRFLTLNLGLRMEREEIPSFADPVAYPEFKDPVVVFGFADKLSPRLGFILDVLKDSSFKIYGSYGIFYDAMKLDLADKYYGGFKWKQSYYTLDTYEWNKIGINGYYPGTYIGTSDRRPPNFNQTDPDLKSMSQHEFSLGIEKVIGKNLMVSLRMVHKNLRYAIEDVGLRDDWRLLYYITNPGYGYSLTEKNGGKMDDVYPDTPRAKRQYWAVCLAVDKKFSHNWWGGLSYTWSSLRGNYSGLASSDQRGRIEPNILLYYNQWHLAFDKNLNPIDGPLPTDRTHQIKGYGSYILPFGLTLGVIIQAKSGTPGSTELNVERKGYLAYNRGDLGRTPFLFWADLYLEYAVKMGKTRLVFSANLENIFDTSTAQNIWSEPFMDPIYVPEKLVLSGDWDPEDYRIRPDPRFKMEYNFFPPIQARVGIKICVLGDTSAAGPILYS